MEQKDLRPPVENYLHKILASTIFAPSARMSRFLRFTVERALDGKSEQLKEYVLGVEVFDRSATYDPRVDPIVRVEARRLRSKLKKYYETEGADDEIVIDLPKGNYAPIFLTKDKSAETLDKAPLQSNSIAVLPLSDMSMGRDTEYFSDGLTEELIHRLTKVGGLMVVAWSSAARLKGQPYDIREIGRQLGVSTVLVGSVRGSVGRVRVTAQLIETSSGRYLWSETYDRKIEDLFAIQEEIARAIVNTLPVVLLDRQGDRLIGRPAHNQEAYNLYLQGRFHWNKRTADGLELGAKLFEQAIALEPDFAPAYSGLADSYTLFADYGLQSSDEVIPAAKAAARRALEIDPTLAEAHASLGMIRSLYDWEWAEGEEHYRRAIELGPGYASARHWFAVDFLGIQGRFGEALEEIDIALQLDPLSPIIREGKGYILMLTRRYEEAVAEYRKALVMDRYFYKAFTSMGRAYIHLGKYDEAIGMLKWGRSLAGDIPSILAALGQTYAITGRPAEAHRILEELSELGARRHVHSVCSALVYVGLGETERALDLLETACANRELAMAGLKVHPAYDAIRGEPRFRAILQKVGLTPESRPAIDGV